MTIQRRDIEALLGKRQFRDVPASEASLEVSAKERIVSGYASVFGNLNGHGEIFREGAFKDTIVNDAELHRHLWFHRPDQVLGRPKLSEDSIGLRFETQYIESELGNEALRMAELKLVDRMSIGFDYVVNGWRWIELDDGRDALEIIAARIWEVSQVTWGSDGKALITDVRSELFAEQLALAPLTTLQELRAAIDTTITALERRARPDTSDKLDSDNSIDDTEVVAIRADRLDGLIARLRGEDREAIATPADRLANALRRYSKLKGLQP